MHLEQHEGEFSFLSELFPLNVTVLLLGMHKYENILANNR